MKNLKKVLALALAFAMVFSTFSSAFAASGVQNSEEAKVLYDLGLFNGTSTTEFVPSLDADADAYQAIKLIGSAMGWDVDSDDTTDFTDVPDWAAPYVAFAVEKGITNGVGGGKFGSAMSTKRFYVWFYRALGYSEDAWNTPYYLVEANLIDVDVAMALATDDSETVLRDKLVGVMYASLNWKAKDSETTLIEDLVANEIVDEDVAVVNDLIEDKGLEVVAVKVLNLVQTKVVFSKAVDQTSAEEEDNYDLTNSDDDEIEITDAELVDDVTVVLTHDNAEQQTIATLEVEDVKDVDEEEKIPDFKSEEIEYEDMTRPEIEKAEVIGIDTIRVYFSEPMDVDAVTEQDNYEVNDDDIYINEITPNNNNTQADILLYSDLDEGTVTLKVTNDVEDTAGFGVMPKTLEIPVVKDDKGPEIVGYKDASTTEVTLIFDGPIIINDEDKENYYHTNDKNHIDDDIDPDTHLSDDGTELTLHFDDHKLSVDGTTFIYIEADSIEDYWNNDNSKISAKVDVEEDVKAPVVDELDVDSETKIILKFDEALDEDSAEELDNYELLDSKGDKVDEIDDIDYISADHEVEITFDDKLSGFYKIVVDNIEDINENKMPKTTLEFEVDDETAPNAADDEWTATLYNAGDHNQMVKVDYGQKMNSKGQYSVTDEAVYTINGRRVDELECDVKVKLVDSGTAVEIRIEPNDDTKDPSETSDDDGLNLSATGDVIIGRVADYEGNYTKEYESRVSLDAEGNVMIDTVEAIAVDTIEVTFDDELKDFDKNDIVVTTDITDATAAETNKLGISKINRDINDDGNTVIKITMKDDLEYTATSQGQPVYVYVIDNESENSNGEPLFINDNKVADDEIAPTLNGGEDKELADYATETTNNVFEVKFSEPLKTPTGLEGYVGNDFIIKAGNDTLAVGNDVDVVLLSGANNDTVQFTLKGDYAGFDGEIKIKLAEKVNYLTDLSGNELEDVDFDDFDILNDPAVESTVSHTKVLVPGEKFTVVFTEELCSDGENAVEVMFNSLSSNFSYSWDDDELEVTSATAFDFNNCAADLMCTIEDKKGNTSSVDLIN